MHFLIGIYFDPSLCVIEVTILFLNYKHNSMTMTQMPNHASAGNKIQSEKKLSNSILLFCI